MEQDQEVYYSWLYTASTESVKQHLPPDDVLWKWAGISIIGTLYPTLADTSI